MSKHTLWLLADQGAPEHMRDTFNKENVTIMKKKLIWKHTVVQQYEVFYNVFITSKDSINNKDTWWWWRADHQY